MTRPVTTGPEATAELAAALAWYEERKPGLGTKLLQAVDRTIRHLGEFPGAGSPLQELPNAAAIRRFSVPGFPYHLVYIELEAETRVLALAHDSRRPGYWSSRLK